jgi:hypothetical protein
LDRLATAEDLAAAAELSLDAVALPAALDDLDTAADHL